MFVMNFNSKFRMILFGYIKKALSSTICSSA